MTDEEFADLIESRTTRRIELEASHIPTESPVVYMALSHDECLYVGMSRKGVARALRPDHHVLKHIRNQIVKIVVYETRSILDAERLEASMIQEFAPKHNDRKYIKTAQRMKGERSRVGEIIARAGY